MTNFNRKRSLANTKRTIRHMLPGHVIRTYSIAREVKGFAEKAGFVYLGGVNKDSEECRLIRGHTVSHSHRDNHYTVGSLRGYDVYMVHRNDVLIIPKPSPEEKRCHWVIFAIDLKAEIGLPHTYVGTRERDEIYRSAYTELQPLYLGASAHYPPKFITDYTVYGKATFSLEIEKYFTPQMASVVESYFDGASFEVEYNTLYVYLESRQPNQAQLEKLLSNGLWLAESIDTIASTESIE